MTNPTPTWPSSAGSSIQALIENLRAVGQSDAEANHKVNVTPYSLQVLQAGATALSRRWAVIVAAAGGLPALLAIFQSITNKLGRQDHSDVVRAAFLVSGSVLLSTVVIAVAIIVRSDVMARATATAAQKQAEATIAVASLTSYQFAQTPPAPIGPFLLKKKDGTIQKVESFAISNGDLHVYSGGQCIDRADIDFIIDSRTVKAE
jgi:hypothetical protein